jgi:lipopolysaccharide/colanic/teichoic acid biosynthesis glycosyltransferase
VSSNADFSCLKFQTIVPDADTVLEPMLKENAEMTEEYSKYHKLHDDLRIGRIGWFVHKTSLDELPQLLNVLRKEMSIVRP